MCRTLKHKLAKPYYHVRSREVWPEQVRVGDQLLFDFPCTGPFWTQPVQDVIQTWTQMPWDDKRRLWIYLVLGSGTLVMSTLDGKIRVKR